jgi:hypothetical protein
MARSLSSGIEGVFPVPQEISGSQWTKAGLEELSWQRKTRALRQAYDLFGQGMRLISYSEYIFISLSSYKEE